MLKGFNDWLRSRGAGVLLHPTSLPGNTGIRTIGSHARRFVDFLVAAGMRYWQVFPLGPTGYGESPYQCFSAFAGNPYLIDLASLVEDGPAVDVAGRIKTGQWWSIQNQPLIFVVKRVLVV
jgi:4-alpha-glucanotransferase